MESHSHIESQWGVIESYGESVGSHRVIERVSGESWVSHIESQWGVIES